MKGKHAPLYCSILMGGFEMGFPSPATDYIEERISLDKLFISHPSATYFMKAANTYWRAGITQGALLIVDCSATPCDGSVVVCKLEGGFIYGDSGLSHISIWNAWAVTVASTG